MFVDSFLGVLDGVGTAAVVAGYGGLWIAGGAPQAVLLAAMPLSCRGGGSSAPLAVPSQLAYLLSPFAVDFSSVVVVFGNAGVILVVFVMQLLCHRAFLSLDEGSPRRAKGRLSVARIFIRCPSIPISVARVLVPGVGVGLVRCFTRIFTGGSTTASSSISSNVSRDAEAAVGAAWAAVGAALACIGLVFVGTWRSTRSALRKCRVTTDDGFSAPNIGFLRHWLAPVDVWVPPEAVASYSSIVASVRRNTLSINGAAWFAVSEALPVVFCAAASAPADRFGLCVPQAGLLAALLLVRCVFVARLQPYAARAQNVLHVASSIALAAFVVSSQMDGDGGMWAQRGSMLATLAFVVLSSVLSGCLSCWTPRSEEGNGTNEDSQEAKIDNAREQRPSGEFRRERRAGLPADSTSLTFLEEDECLASQRQLLQDVEFLNQLSRHHAGLTFSRGPPGAALEGDGAGSSGPPKRFVVTCGKGDDAVVVGTASLEHSCAADCDVPQASASPAAVRMIAPLLTSMSNRLEIEESAHSTVCPLVVQSQLSSTLALLAMFRVPPASHAEQQLRLEALLRCASAQRIL